VIKFIIYLVFVLFAYSCAPINKQHGYMVDDMYFAAKDIESLKSNKSNKNDVLKALGSPSVKIRDVDDVWIYLVSVKQKNIFEEDEINFIQIIRYEFDNNGNVIKYDLLDKNNFKQIAFSDEKTTITRDAYGISDQIYDAFTRGSTN
tara:strand:+ start:3055 stop:3495 length:441 start_codon:yes stop_codon:yes gene_type:complete